MITCRKNCFLAAVLLAVFFLNSTQAAAYWIWSAESGKFVSSDTVSQEESEELLKYAMSFRQEKNGERSIAELENLLRKFPSSHVAPDAQYQIGLIYEENNDLSRAFEAYKKLMENYPQSEKSDEVIERVYGIGLKFLSGYKDKVAGVVNVSRLPKSVEVFEHIVKLAPFGKFGDQAQFQIGVAYKMMGRYREAVDAFQKFVDRYPSSALLDDAYFQLAESSYAFSSKATRDQYALEDAITNISNYLQKYPESNASDKVQQLKKEIEERDAEKNFRIGLYYEAQNELESARLYFEDVSKKYPNTVAGKQAAEKLSLLGTSIEALRKNQQMLGEKMEAVEAKLKGLDYEQEALKAKIKSQGNLSAESEALKKLEDERMQLESKKNEMQNSLERRIESLKSREAAWHIKKKNFDEKRKDLRSNPAPELTSAFSRWEESLKQERAELDKERQALIGFQSELGEEPSRFAFRIPFISKKKMPLEEVLNYRQKDLEKIRSEREAVVSKRTNLERNLNQLSAQSATADRKDFVSGVQSAAFQDLLTSERADLKTKQMEVGAEQEKLKALTEEFRRKKSEYQQAYGSDFAVNISPDLGSIQGRAGLELTIAQSSKETLIQQLQQDKGQLVDAIVAQKRLVTTLTSAFNSEIEKGKLKVGEVKQEEGNNEEKPVSYFKKPAYELTPEELNLDPRDVRKRIKALEREMRKLFDEIEDWDAKKRKMIADLDLIMNGERRESSVTKAANTITWPLRSFFWLTRSLAFGLANEDKQVVRQAARRTKGGALGPEDEKVRALHQEIELQTVLIQSRHEEIMRLSDNVKALEYRLETVRRDDQVLRHVFLEKESAVADESLRSADQIVAPEDRLPILISRIDQETQKLQELERRLNDIDEKLVAISQAPDESAAPSVPAQNTDTESAEGEQASQAKEKATAELTGLKQKIDSDAAAFQAHQKALDAELEEFYNRKKTSGAIPEQTILGDAKQQQKNMSRELEDLYDLEYRLLRSQAGTLEDKNSFLAKELKRSRGKDDLIRHQAILTEQERVKAELAEVQAELKAFKT